VQDAFSQLARTIRIPFHAEPRHSKQLLYWHNFRVALDRINRVISFLDAADPSATDEIAEKVNTIRRIVEFVLKVECCSRDLGLTKNYSQIILGDLIARVKHGRDASLQTFLGRFAEISNEFSHDSGKPVELIKAKRVSLLALAYTSFLEIEHRPSIR